MKDEVWIKHLPAANVYAPIAVVGSPGLRSIGKLVVERIIKATKAHIVAELYSTHLPSVYETKPSYAAHPSLPGEGGVIVEAGQADLPKVQFYASEDPPLVVVKGYHANFAGQYNVAEKVLDYLADLQTKRLIVVAGYGSKEKKVVCAANNPSLIQEMKERYSIDVGYKGPFMGFSGLVFGLAKLKGMEAICLFSGAEPREDDLEFPDEEASERALEKLNPILGLPK